MLSSVGVVSSAPAPRLMSHGDYDYGLEDKLLRKNIPGRYTTWEKDCDEEGSKARSEWQETTAVCADSPTFAPVVNMESSVATSTGGPNTGIKGVLRDYRDEQARTIAEREADKEEARAAWHQEAYGTVFREEHAAISTHVAQSHTSDGEKQYLRQRRLLELRSSGGLPLFGEVREVNAFGFLDAIENEVSFNQKTPLIRKTNHLLFALSLFCR